jgi:fibronectin type 3 domain-containing protein
VGYNVYRSTVSGGPFLKINSALNASTNFVDNIVQAGSTYYYVTTAVNGSGVESAYSNQVKAAIPTP